MRFTRHRARRKIEGEVIHVTEDSDKEDEKSGPVEESVDLVSKLSSVSVKLVDLKTLEHEQYLNDIIIDFYLNYLKEQVLPPDDRDGVHIFSTIFYACLNTDKRHRDKIPAREKRHLAVAGWTKSVNIFEKNLLVIPICEHSHWYLLLVVKPGLVTTAQETNNNGEPLIIVLDSLGGNKTTAVRYVREYLAEEWAVKLGRDRGQAFKFSAEQMKTVRPTKVK